MSMEILILSVFDQIKSNYHVTNKIYNSIDIQKTVSYLLKRFFVMFFYNVLQKMFAAVVFAACFVVYETHGKGIQKPNVIHLFYSGISLYHNLKESA